MYVLTWDREGYTLISEENCFIVWGNVEFDTTPALELRSGVSLRPGDRVTYLGGPHTASGFRRVDLIKPITYLGLFSCFDGPLALFEEEPTLHEGKRVYYAWKWLADERQFLFVQRSGGARIVETENAKILTKII